MRWVHAHLEARSSGTCLPSAPISMALATRWSQRLLGLFALPVLSSGQGLLIKPCDSIHTCFMSYPIAVVYIDGEGQVIKVVRRLAPWRFSWAKGAHAALELHAESPWAESVQVGHFLKWNHHE